MWSFLASFAMHHLLFMPFRVVRAMGQAVNYALPYTSVAAVKGNVNFDTKHLSKGDPLPPFNGKLRVYNMRYCPFAQRTILALNAKQVDYEVVNIDLVDKPEWLTNKSAFGKVPALEVEEGVCIYESLVTVEYLDDVYPQRQLLPKDPLKKAFDKIIVEASEALFRLYIKIVKFPDSVDEATIKGYRGALDFIQEQMKARGSKFLDGDEPGFADYMIWPWFERIAILEDDERIRLDRDKYKLLVRWMSDMYQDPAVSQYLIPTEIWIKFQSFYTEGVKPNYELLNEN